MKTPAACIEALEDRIAPAVIFTFTDMVDGDLVKLVSDKPLKASVTYAANGSPGMITLTGAGLDGANLSTVVTRSATGDGLVNIGQISAPGLDLGNVSVSGDLVKIVCGDANNPLPGLKSLKVRSMGLFGSDTLLAGDDIYSQITGDLGSLNVAGDLIGVGITATGKAGAIKIGGDLRGGDKFGAGRINAAAIASINIAGDLTAGLGDETGKIIANGDLGKVSIGGSIVGALDNVADTKGQIYAAGDAGPIRIGKNIIGATSEQKTIEILGHAGAITVGGSLLAGAGKLSGAITVGGDAGFIKIGRDIQGGAGEFSGRIKIGGKVAGFTVGHDVRGGTGSQFEATVLTQISFARSTGPVKIGGDVAGSTGYGSATINLGSGAPSLTVGGSIIGGGGLFGGLLGLPSGEISCGNVAVVSIGGSLSGGAFNGGDLLALSIGKLTIKGSLVASSGIDSMTDTQPLLQVHGNLGSAKIGGGVVGPGIGSPVGNATIQIDGNLGTLAIKGSVTGGAAILSGAIQVGGNAGAVNIGGSLGVGTGFKSGGIFVAGRLAALGVGSTVQTAVTASSFGSVKIGGDLRGDLAAIGTGFDSITVGGSLISDAYGGTVSAISTLGTVKIGGSINGSNGPGSANLSAQFAGDITIGGDIVGNGGKAQLIEIKTSAGAIKVGGDVRGPANGNTRLLFDDGLSLAQGFASFTVKGGVANVTIASGVSPNLLFGAQPDSTIGPVKVGGNWTASNLAVGIAAGADKIFGTMDDGPLPATKLSRIASVSIAGQVLGSAALGDHFGFVARNIGPIKIGGTTYTPGATPIELAPLSHDVTIRVV
jgi:hypothetical protein